MATCCCSRTQTVNRHLQGFAPGTPLAVLLQDFGGREQVPAQFEQTYQRIIAFARSRGRRVDRIPTLVFAPQAGGKLAFYDALHNIIVVGTTEIESYVLSLWQHHNQVVRSLLLDRLSWASQLTDEYLYSELRSLVVEMVVAHEVGHIGQDTSQGPQVVREEDADSLSASWSARQGLPRGLGELLFTLLGCTSETCSHPRPKARRANFLQSFNSEVSQMVAEMEEQRQARAAEEYRQQMSARSSSGDGWLIAGAAAVLALVFVAAANEKPQRRRR